MTDAYCPKCNVAMLCPCSTCKPENEGRPGAFWKFKNDDILVCGNCGYSPEERAFIPGEDPLAFLADGWDAIALNQLKQDSFWPEVI